MKKDLQHGQWLFTCSMKPKQFGVYDPANPADYSDADNMGEDRLDWCKYDSFTTLEGSIDLLLVN